MRQVFRCFLLVLALAAAVALPAAAQQFPSQQRGLSADTAYQSGELDSVNLFNGNLSLEIPLGQSFPVGPAFSLSFALQYNSKVWDYDEKVCQQTLPTQAVPYDLPQPDKFANAGLGWLLTPGRLLDPSTVAVENPFNPGPNWVYVSSDGGHHALYPSLHPGYPATPSANGTLYSNDGTYLRQKKLAGTECRAVAGTGGDCRVIEFPDGARHEFRSFGTFNWRVVRMADSYGNAVDVDYQIVPGGPDQKWTFKDPHGRSQVVDFENGRVRWLRLEAFGGATANWEFQYTTATIPRHNYTQLSCLPAAPPVNVPVTFLHRIVRPDGSYFEFDYNRSDASTLSGAINHLRYPTGGSLSWTYQNYGFPREDGSATSGPSAGSYGVATKTSRLSTGAVVGTWTYDVTANGNPMGPGQNKAPCFHTMRITDPLGQDTEHFFSSIYNSHFWAYGLPYTYCDPDTGAYDDTSGSFLSKRVWAGAAGSSALLRSHWVEYDTDGPLAAGDQNRNHRLRYQKTVFEDHSHRQVETVHSDFDGLGNWRQTVVQGSFGPSKTRTTSYRPGGGTLLLGDDTSLPQSGNSFEMPAEGDRWLFGTSTRSSVKQGSGAEIVTETCFDGQTGFLTRSRQLAGTVPQAFGQTRSFIFDGRGFLLAETHPEIGPAGNGATSYQYDALGHAIHSQVAGSADFELRSAYDRAGRLTRVEQKSGSVWKPLKEFFYARASDGIDRRGGKLVRAKRHNWVDPIAPGETLGSIDAIVTDEYRYEGVGGRTSHKTTSFHLGASTNAFESSYAYDDFGNLVRIVYPEAINWPLSRSKNPREVEYGYTLGFLTEVEDYAPQVTYQLGGMLHQIDYQSGATWTQAFSTADHLPRPYTITVAGVNSGFSAGPYFYDGQNNISQIGSLLYRYDRLGRLVRGDTPNGAGTSTQTAAYDDFGNLTSLTTAGVAQSLPTQTTTNRLTTAGYDAAGNVTSLALGAGATYSYNFDGLRKMISLRSTSNQARLFFYDANDERLFAWDCPQSSCNPDHDFERWTLRGLGGEVLRTFAGSGKFTTLWEEDFVYGSGSLLASIRPSATPGQEDRRYVAVDHLGSTRLVWNEQNQTQDRYDFHPFGQEVAPFAVGDPPLKFTGHERDQNGGGKGLLDYMHARYASPFTARFLSVDPVLGRPVQPQSWNRYAYALNNPIKYTDPNGETPNEAAVAGQNKISEINHDVVELGFDVLPAPGAIVFATVIGSIADFSSMLLDPLRFGDAVGTAVGSDSSYAEIVMAGVQDGFRGAALVSGGGGAAGKLITALKPVSLEVRTLQIHGALHPVAQTQRTTAILQTNGPRVVGGGARDLTPGQRALLKRSEIAARLPGAHAEVTVLNHALDRGLTPSALATSRPLCSECISFVESLGGRLTSPTTVVWP